MVSKGSIYGGIESDKKVYSCMPLAIGMYEYQIERLAEDFAKLKKKKAEQSLPKDMNDMYSQILMKKIGKLNMLKIGAKMLLKSKV